MQVSIRFRREYRKVAHPISIKDLENGKYKTLEERFTKDKDYAKSILNSFNLMISDMGLLEKQIKVRYENIIQVRKQAREQRKELVKLWWQAYNEPSCSHKKPKKNIDAINH